MTDQEMQELYAEMVRSRHPGLREDCASPEALAALAERRAPEAERLRILRHVAGCPSCRAELELLRATEAAGRGVARPRLRPLALAASIAALMLAGTLWFTRLGPWVASGDDVTRGPSGGVALIGPAGSVSASERLAFVWHPFPGALCYQVEVDEEDGRLVYEATTADTVLTLPGTVRLRRDVAYRWWVRAVLADGTQGRSAAGRFLLENR